MNNRLFFLLFFTFLLTQSYSQTTTSFASNNIKKYGTQKAKPGTYQFIVYDTKIKYFYTEETFLYIEDMRKENEDVTLRLNRMTEVFIPSRKKVGSPDFSPLSEFLYK